MIGQSWARYAGTEIHRKGKGIGLARVYIKDKFWIRGNGKIELRDDGINFKRYGVRQPIFIPYDKIKDVAFGRWHARGWQMWTVIKIIWQKDEDLLSTGFVVSRHKKKTEKFASKIKERILK